MWLTYYASVEQLGYYHSFNRKIRNTIVIVVQELSDDFSVLEFIAAIG